MSRSLAVLGTALTSVLAMSVLACSAASGDVLSSEASPVKLTGINAKSMELKTETGSIGCESATFTATAATPATSIEVTPIYSKCLFGVEAVVKMNGCVYVLHIAEAGTTGTLDIKCPAGAKMTIETFPYNGPKCIIEMASQSGLNGVTYANVGVGTTREVRVDFNVEGIENTLVKGPGMFPCTPKTGSTGAIKGSVTFTGETTAAEPKHLGIFMK